MISRVARLERQKPPAPCPTVYFLVLIDQIDRAGDGMGRSHPDSGKAVPGNVMDAAALHEYVKRGTGDPDREPVARCGEKHRRERDHRTCAPDIWKNRPLSPLFSSPNRPVTVTSRFV